MPSEYEKEQAAEKAAQDKAVAAVRAAVDADDTSFVSSVLADVLSGAKCGRLALEWVAERFWALRMPPVLDQLNRIYGKLVADGVTETKKIDFNDLDDAVWYEPSDKYKVVVHTMQNRNFLYIWRKDDDELAAMRFRKLHVRQFYDQFNDPRFGRGDDKYEKKEESKFKARVAKAGRAAAVKEASWMVEYADDGVQYPERLSLAAYRKLGFMCKYGDARDPGYILSWDEFGGKVDNAQISYHHLSLIEECYVPGMIYTLFEEEV